MAKSGSSSIAFLPSAARPSTRRPYPLRLEAEGPDIGRSRPHRPSLTLYRWFEFWTLLRLATYRKRPGSDTAGTILRDHQIPIPLRTVGNWAFRPDSQQPFYAFAAEAVTLSFLIRGEPDWTGLHINPKRRFVMKGVLHTGSAKRAKDG